MLACRLPEDYSESAGVMVENPALEAFTAEEHIMQYPIQQQEAWHPTICSTAAKSSIKKEEEEEKTTPNRDNCPPLTTQACLSAITQPSSPNYLIFFLSPQNLVSQKLIYISYSYWLLISTESFMGEFKSFGICYRSNGALIIPTDKKLE